MKLKKIINNIRQAQRTLMGRIASRLTLFMSLLFMAFLVVTVFQAIYVVRKGVIRDADIQVEHIQGEMSDFLYSISSVADNLVPMAQKYMEGPRYDSLGICSLLQSVLEFNPNLRGCCFVLDPSYLERNGQGYAVEVQLAGKNVEYVRYLCLYAMRDHDSISVRQLGEENYDYTQMDWYAVSKRTHQSYWADPYDSPAGNGIEICSYSHPIFDDAGEFVGEIVVDLEMWRMADLINRSQLKGDSYYMMLDRNADIVLYPNDSIFAKHSMYALNTSGFWNIDSAVVGQVIDSMLAGAKGKICVSPNDAKAYMFYAPVPSTGWSLAYVCPFNVLYDDITILVIILIFFVVVALVLIALYVRKVVAYVSRPLVEFSVSAHQVTEGDVTTPLIDIKTRGELQELRSSFAHMQRSISSYLTQVQEASLSKQRMESELAIASSNQAEVLPIPSEITNICDNVDIYAKLKSAREVGGDLYDFRLDGNRLSLVIGDVSGKGVPATILMSVTRSIVRLLNPSFSLVRVMELVNRVVLDSNKSNMFVTLFVANIDLDTGEMTYSNAGHPAPLMVSPIGEVWELPVDTNLPLGCIEKCSFTEQHLRLDPGTLMLLYTDGVVESEDTNNELYGIKRLKGRLSLSKNLTAEQVIEGIYADVLRHAGAMPQSDDITILSMRFLRMRSVDSVIPLVMKNYVSEINKLYDYVSQIAFQLGFDHSTQQCVTQSLEEIVANVIEYGYPDDEEEQHTFEVRFRREGDMAQFQIIDDGVPFDPTTYPNPDLSLPLDRLTIGGWGIYLTRQMMDEMIYSREGSKNVLTLRKRIKKSK